MPSDPTGPIHSGQPEGQKATDARIESALQKLTCGDLSTLVARNWKQQLASELGLSYSRFQHLFKQRIGLPPGHYIKLARLQEAKRLLDKTAIPIKHVMFLVGLEDASHFSRDFKALTGFSPMNYRKRPGKASSSR